MALLNHVIGILTKPKDEWLLIKEKSINTTQLFTGYIAILALIPAIVYFISISWIVIKMFAFSIIVYGLISTLFYYAFILVSVYVSALIINALAPNFKSKQNMNNALKLVAFSYTPILIAGIFSMLPIFGGFLSYVLSLYGLYLLYLGLEPLMETPTSEKNVYFVITLLVMVAIFVIATIVLMLPVSLLLSRLFFSF